MDEVFINKIKQIILNNLEDEKFGVRNLSSEIGLSGSQILRKVKAATGKSVSKLINEIRLNEAIKLLREENYNTSEIAYKVGFSSPSYFAKCFHNQFGLPPSEIKLAQEDFVDEPLKQKQIVKPKKHLLKKAFIYSISMVLLLASYQLYHSVVEKPISIAILPFKDLSEKNDKEYLSDGFTESLTLELARRGDLRVISRTSAMSYKNKDKRSSEIAKELQVDYLLEGSILCIDDSIKVVVQLIKPFPKEKHIWQDAYNQKCENILQLVENLSNEISKEINSAISLNAIGSNDYKVDAKAYNLYLRGRHLWREQSDETVISSINFLNESIDIDSSFAPAYVALAEAYITLNLFSTNKEETLLNREKSRRAINKALELDNTLAAAYITKGNILGKFDWNWSEMKTMLEKGLKLDPNNAYGHMLLSDYYIVNGNFKRAINEALIAEKLDPMNPMIGTMVGEKYCMVNNIEKSIEQYKKVLELFPRYGSALSELGFVLFINSQKEEAKNTFIKLQETRGNYEMVKAYKEKSMDDVFRFWLSGVRKGDPKYCSYPILVAQVHMLLNEKQEALEYLEIAYKYHNEYLPIMLFRPDFYPLHNETRFQEIAKKVGVVLPKPNQ